MIVYGGYSQRCNDFCSDVWTFNISRCETTGHCVWKQVTILDRKGPGKYGISPLRIDFPR
jgi:hypothetical protein